MVKIMGDFCLDIRTSVLPNPSSRQMKNNTYSVQYSGEIISRSISRAHDGKICSWAGIIGPF